MLPHHRMLSRCAAGLIGLAACFTVFAQDEGEEAPFQLFEADGVLAWADLEANGNTARLYNYRSIADQLYGDLLGATLHDSATWDRVFDGYWRGIDARDRTGFAEVLFPGTGHYLRFRADDFAYFVDPSDVPAPASRETLRVMRGYLAGAPNGLSLTATYSDRQSTENDFIRLRPTPGLDYRTQIYDLDASHPLWYGNVSVGFRAVGLDEKAGLRPTGWTRDLTVATSQELSSGFSADFLFSDSKTTQEGLGAASLRSWRLGAAWQVTPNLFWRGNGQISRASLPFTLNRYASNRDRVSTDLTWRPGRGVSVQGGYNYRAWEQVEEGSPVIERPASNEGWAVVRFHNEAIGGLYVRYRYNQIVDAPLATIVNLASNATLYYDRIQRVDAHWSRPFGYATSLYAGYQYSKQENSERDFELRRESLNAGVSTQFSPRLSGYVDYLVERWGSNWDDLDGTGLNTGETGVINPGAPNRPLFSDGQVITVGLNYMLTDGTDLDGTFSSYMGDGGDDNDTTFFAVELRHRFLSDFSIGVGYQREVFSDDYVSAFDYDDNVFRVTLTGTFSTR